MACTLLFACALLLACTPSARAADPELGECAPPRTMLALLPLADHTDHTWAMWTGESPAFLVARQFADTLEQRRGHIVVCTRPDAGDAGPATPLSRAVDDEQALLAAHRAHAEIAVSGTVNVFTHDDHREPGRLSRWGVGAPDARSHVQISITLRMLDALDGSVLIETTVSRERFGRGTASVAHPDPDAAAAPTDPLVDQVLSEVLCSLVRTVNQRLDARWQAHVMQLGRDGNYRLDAGASRGLFTGERLDIWRMGIQMFDENLTNLGGDRRVGAVVIIGFERSGYACARLVEGEAHMGDRVRPCAEGGEPSLSVRR